MDKSFQRYRSALRRELVCLMEAGSSVWEAAQVLRINGDVACKWADHYERYGDRPDEDYGNDSCQSTVGGERCRPRHDSAVVQLQLPDVEPISVTNVGILPDHRSCAVPPIGKCR